jgi:hypothetical protein
MKMGVRNLVLGLSIACLCGSAQATPLPRYGLFVFSNLCSEPESGDVNGGRLILVRVPGSDSARISYTGEGGLDEAPAEDVQIGKDGRISLRYLSQYDAVTGRSNAYVTVTGTISAEAFEQTAKDGKPFRTSRVGPGQPIPVCR